MNEKVHLPKEVVKAIEMAKFHYVSNVLTDPTLLRKHADKGSPSCEIILREWGTEETRLRYLSAIVNGYQVEETPEEKVREYYEHFNQPFAERFMESEQHVIAKTLNLLGIKIEGVNA